MSTAKPPRRPWGTAIVALVTIVFFFGWATESSPIINASSLWICVARYWGVPALAASHFALAACVVLGSYGVGRFASALRAALRRRKWVASRARSVTPSNGALVGLSVHARALVHTAVDLRRGLDRALCVDEGVAREVLALANAVDAQTTAHVGGALHPGLPCGNLTTRISRVLGTERSLVNEALVVDRIIASWLAEVVSSTRQPVRL